MVEKKHTETAEEIEQIEEDVIEEEIVSEEIAEIKKEAKESDWVPKTRLGQDVLKGKYKSLEEILEKGMVILEPEIVDFFVPDLASDIIKIGGSPGKGGGIMRTATKRTARMHKSGRRFKLTAIVVVGNNNGLLGMGQASSREHRIAIEKSLARAKTGIIRVRRGCGSWECGCGGNHSIPFKTDAKYGSIKIKIFPGPKGLGIVADKTTRKILEFAGIKDAWVETRGSTDTRNNLAFAVFEALRKMNSVKGDFINEEN